MISNEGIVLRWLFLHFRGSLSGGDKVTRQHGHYIDVRGFTMITPRLRDTNTKCNKDKQKTKFETSCSKARRFKSSKPEPRPCVACQLLTHRSRSSADACAAPQRRHRPPPHIPQRQTHRQAPLTRWTDSETRTQTITNEAQYLKPARS